MFKKALLLAEKVEIGAKERKKLKKSLSEQFNENCIERLFQMSDRLFASKFAKSKLIVYGDETDPLFADPTANGDFFPTLYCLQLFPQIVKGTLVARAAVDFAARAELRLDDVDLPRCVGEFAADEVCALLAPTPVAVLAAACDSRNLRAGAAETVGYLLHCEGDALWAVGSGTPRKPATTEQIAESSDEEQIEETGDSAEQLLALVRGNKDKATKGANVVAKPNRTQIETKKNEKTKSKTDKKEEPQNSRAVSANERNAAWNMDKHIREAFLHGLTLKLNDKDLPLSAAAAWKDIILPFAPTGVALDVKDSSFKKLNRLFQHFARDGLIDFEETAQRGGAPQIVAVNRAHKLIEGFEPTAQSARVEATAETAARRSYSERNTIINFCRPLPTLRKYLGNWNGESLTLEELRRLLTAQLRELRLIVRDEVAVTSELNADFALGVLVDDETAEKANLKDAPRVKLERLLEKAKTLVECSFAIIDSGGNRAEYRGQFEGARLFAEKAKGKVVVRASNISPYGFDMEALLADVCAALSVTGQLVDAQTGKLAQKELVINAGLLEEMKEFVERRLGLEVAEIVNKVDKKKKKGGN